MARLAWVFMGMLVSLVISGCGVSKEFVQDEMNKYKLEMTSSTDSKLARVVESTDSKLARVVEAQQKKMASIDYQISELSNQSSDIKSHIFDIKTNMLDNLKMEKDFLEDRMRTIDRSINKFHTSSINTGSR